MFQFQDVWQVSVGGVREFSIVDGVMDGYICFRRVQVKRVDGVGVRFFSI